MHCMHMAAQGGQRGPGAEMTGDCEPPDVHTGN